MRSHRSAALLMSLIGCAVEPSSPVPADGGASTTIGASGGVVLGDGVTLTVPQGALASPTVITITRTDEAIPPGYVGYSPVWRFAPEGLAFAVPATVQIAFVGDASRAGMYWSRQGAPGYERLAGVVAGGSVVAPVSHFSRGFVGDEIASDGGRVDASTEADAITDAAVVVDATTDVELLDAATDAPGDVAFDAPASDSAPSDVALDAPSVDAPVPDVAFDAPTSDAPPSDRPAADVGCPGDCGVTIAVARPLSPAPSTTVTSRRPTLRWALAAGADGAHVDLCRDRALMVSCVSLDVTGSEMTPGADLEPGRWFWRLRGRAAGSPTSATWYFRVGSAGPLGLDVNGDGFDDLAVANPLGNAVYVYEGSPAGLRNPPSAQLAGVVTDGFGAVLSAAGDVNGDGYGDLLVGAAGTGRLFLGGAAGVATNPAQTLAAPGTGALLLAAAGDIDRDGYGDVLVGAIGAATASVYYGGPSGLTLRGAPITCGVLGGCGGIVASAGDINRDGFADVLLGSRGSRVELHLGSATGVIAAAATTLNNGSGGGIATAGALGDINGDGYGDVFLGSANASPGALIHLGTATGLESIPSSNVLSAGTPFVPVGAGDVNGDGFGDLVMPGPVRVFMGSATGLRTLPLVTFSSGGGQVATGDFNGDGFRDIAANGYAPSVRVSLFMGGSGGPSERATSTLSDPVPVSGFGRVFTAINWGDNDPIVATSAGVFYCESGTFACHVFPHAPGDRAGADIDYPADTNGDGVFEVLVGAPGAEAVYVFEHEPEGRLVTILRGPAGARGFGSAVATAGDVNRDGTYDVIVGAPDSDRAYVYVGTRGAASAPIVLTGPAGSHFGRMVSTALDLNNDYADDVIVASDNRVDVFMGSLTGTTTTPALTLTGLPGSRFGEAAGVAGDVNGDGASDFAVGAPGLNTVYVYHGNTTRLSAVPSTTLTGAAGSEFGTALMAGAHVDSSAGFHDLFVGAPGANVAYLYSGSAGGLGTTPTAGYAGTAGSRFGARIEGSRPVRNLGLRPSLNTHNVVSFGAPGAEQIVQYGWACSFGVPDRCRLENPGVRPGTYVQDVAFFGGSFGAVIASQ